MNSSVKVDNDTLLWNGENQFFKEMGIELEIISLQGIQVI